MVSIHARAKRATSCASSIGRPDMFQFTPARSGRRVLAPGRGCSHDVSIHARAKRATCACSLRSSSRRFQFTPARSGRHNKLREALKQVKVSIHARAKRATAGGRIAADRYARFNSRPREAGDFSLTATVSTLLFQFTPARSGRRTRAPRLGLRHVSIHARAKRATSRRQRCGTSFGFQFTPARSGRRELTKVTLDASVFQFTPARSGRRRRSGRAEVLCGFNSRPREAGDFGVTFCMDEYEGFNSRPREAGDSSTDT